MPSRAGFKAATKGGKVPPCEKDDPKAKGKDKGKKMPPWLKGKKK